MKYYYSIPLISIFLAGCASINEENIYYSTNNYQKQTTKQAPKLKPYKVLGRWYYPRKVNVGETFEGISSWYGPNFHGKLTANGEIYNMYAFTAANKILPMNTIIKVTNLYNHKSVVVRVNDRGPFVKERILDLSYSAGKKIGLDKTGTAPVKIIVLSTATNNNKIIKKLPIYKKFSKKNGKIKIQIGAFNHLSGAKIFKQEYRTANKNIYIQKIDGKYKVFIGSFKTYQKAKDFKNDNKIKGFIVK